MQLLVSVSDMEDALEALAGGAGFIDAKDPRAGALGAVRLPVFHQIRLAVGAARPITAALGDASRESDVEALARAFAAAGAALVKVGFAGLTDPARIAPLLAAAMRGAAAAGRLPDGERACGVIAVAYADHARAASPAVGEIVSNAARVRCRGVLIDTYDKEGPGLCSLLGPEMLAGYTAACRQAGLLATLAGRLSGDDIETVRDAGADVAGVRGAACDGGRDGRVRAGKVRSLLARCTATAAVY